MVSPAQLARQVYVRMSPAPVNLSQSRSVLKALQRFGEVASFLNLKYVKAKTMTTGRSALVIFDTAHAASEAMKASPLEVTFPSSSSSTSNTSSEQQQPTDNESDLGVTEKTPFPESQIICEIEESRYDHKITMRNNPYNMPFFISRSWREVHDLLNAPDTAAPMEEIADCFTSRKISMPFRHQDRIVEENTEEGATSLMGMWKKGLERAEVEGKEGSGEVGEESSER